MQVKALSVVLLAWLVQLCVALKFEVEAKPLNSYPRCIRDFVTKDTMVIANIKSSGYTGDGQNLNIFIIDNKGNEYGRKKGVTDKLRMAFTAHTDAAFDICFENTHLDKNRPGPLTRQIELDVEIGANARDWNSIQAAEKLKPTDLELRRIEELTDEIQRELEYLKVRETRLRNTNESTNRRVKVFSVGVIFALLALGCWQIYYLRTYFRAKHII
ncbi:endoplasmic reticulum vesicle protein 25 [Trichomonascus vanleenenianus]|uniref:Erv25p n=1 Tax=Trichomonascus vanleenenianus TaxID=2268995 RepID=UPI003EC9F55F